MKKSDRKTHEFSGGKLLKSKDDPYGKNERAPGIGICAGCKAVFISKRWSQNPVLYKELAANHNYNQMTCPACRKIADNYPGGILTLSGDYFSQHRTEILQIIENETRRTQEKNPLERIMEMNEERDRLAISTTTVSLSQRLGRLVYRAHKGDLEFKWSQDSKFARILWHRD